MPENQDFFAFEHFQAATIGQGKARASVEASGRK